MSQTISRAQAVVEHRPQAGRGGRRRGGQDGAGPATPAAAARRTMRTTRVRASTGLRAGGVARANSAQAGGRAAAMWRGVGVRDRRHKRHRHARRGTAGDPDGQARVPAAPWLLRADDEHAPRAVAAGLVAAAGQHRRRRHPRELRDLPPDHPDERRDGQVRAGLPEPVAASNAQVFALIAEGRHRVDHRSVESRRGHPRRDAATSDLR